VARPWFLRTAPQGLHNPALGTLALAEQSLRHPALEALASILPHLLDFHRPQHIYTQVLVQEEAQVAINLRLALRSARVVPLRLPEVLHLAPPPHPPKSTQAPVKLHRLPEPLRAPLMTTPLA
jgi:hypothetical protein